MVLKVSVVKKLVWSLWQPPVEVKNVGSGSLDPSIAENGISQMGAE